LTCSGLIRKDLFKTLIDRLPFFLREHTASEQRARVSAAGANVDVEEDSVDSERSVQFFENRIALLLKSSLP
jgi:hypothetical protein